MLVRMGEAAPLQVQALHTLHPDEVGGVLEVWRASKATAWMLVKRTYSSVLPSCCRIFITCQKTSSGEWGQARRAVPALRAAMSKVEEAQEDGGI
jgi:hypothetical protein